MGGQDIYCVFLSSFFSDRRFAGIVCSCNRCSMTNSDNSCHLGLPYSVLGSPEPLYPSKNGCFSLLACLPSFPHELITFPPFFISSLFFRSWFHFILFYFIFSGFMTLSISMGDHLLFCFFVYVFLSRTAWEAFRHGFYSILFAPVVYINYLLCTCHTFISLLP